MNKKIRSRFPFIRKPPMNTFGLKRNEVSPERTTRVELYDILRDIADIPEVSSYNELVSDASSVKNKKNSGLIEGPVVSCLKSEDSGLVKDCDGPSSSPCDSPTPSSRAGSLVNLITQVPKKRSRFPFILKPPMIKFGWKRNQVSSEKMRGGDLQADIPEFSSYNESVSDASSVKNKKNSGLIEGPVVSCLKSEDSGLVKDCDGPSSSPCDSPTPSTISLCSEDSLSIVGILCMVTDASPVKKPPKMLSRIFAAIPKAFCCCLKAQPEE
ncbi:uncharacterized protein LOC143486019 [Brachyhypopomus gauderio]|uniref:uncharacterized protein LOC143486018 n=1 Tax=Brachyhypopomus gauderio TaxID=698409 RepID=UPI0040413D57